MHPSERGGPLVHINGGSRTRGLPRHLLRAWVRDILVAEGFPHAEVSLTFVDTPAMVELNERYTGRKGTTDVLAFSQQEGDYPAPDPGLLGDVVIDVAQVRRNARAYGVRRLEEMLRVAAHGVLHLLGYEHEAAEAHARMRQAEDRYIERFFRRRES